MNGIEIVIFPERIGKFTGRVYFPFQDSTDRHRTFGTNRTAIQYGINAVCGIVYEIQHNLVGEVAKHDHFIIRTVIFCLLQTFQHRSFLFAEGKIVALISVPFLAGLAFPVVKHLVIGTFTTNTGKHKHCCVITTLYFYVFRNFVPRRFMDIYNRIQPGAYDVLSAVATIFVPIIKIFVYR